MILEQYKAYGLGLTRIVTGLMMFHAGYVKLFVWKLPAVTGNFDKMGIPLAQLSAPLVAGLELAGGAALTLGIFTRYLGVIFAIQFLVATYAVGVLLGKGWAGARLEVLLVVVFVLLATNGGGALNLGNLLRKGS
jgi:putative oxidoreductase